VDNVAIEWRRFPTSVGVLLGASLCLHLAALIEITLGTALTAATAFLIGQFCIALALLRLYDGKWVIQDIRLFFVVFLFLYGATLPIVVVSGLGGIQPGLTGAAFMYGTAFLGFNLVQWWYRQPFHDTPPEVFRRIKPSFLNALALIGSLAFILAYALALGVRVSFTIDRGQVGYLGTQLWVVSMFVVNGFVMYMISAWSNLTRSARIVVVASALFFILFQLAMGNRRDFLPMLVFLAGIIATRRHMVIKLGTVIAGAIAFVAFTAIGIVRQVIRDPSVLTRFDPIEILVTQNEFVSPIFTLMHYVDNIRPLRWGMTYLAAPTLFVPRAIWPLKPESLSLQFMRDAFGTTGLMGFAYTPVTEAFLNFSYIGPFVVFAILSLLLVKLVRNADAHPGLYFVSFALVVDFHRGDSGGTFYALSMVGGAYWFMTIASRLHWAPRTVKSPWPATARATTPAVTQS
jgi:oligosaccharide repeat unit polymerase